MRIVMMAGPLALAIAVPAQAQIGTGWSLDSMSRNLQKDGNVFYSNSSGIETFRLNDSSAKRCEQRFTTNYSSGSHQFEGWVRATGTPRSAGNSIQQILSIKTSGQGDVSQVRYYSSSGGTLKVLQSGITMATGVYGVYERINCIHYRSTGKIELWLNGSKKSTHADAGSSAQYYFKYGIYIAGSSGRPQTQWKSIKVWKK